MSSVNILLCILEFLFFFLHYLVLSVSDRLPPFLQGGTKKRELLKNPTKSEEIQQKKMY